MVDQRGAAEVKVEVEGGGLRIQGRWVEDDEDEGSRARGRRKRMWFAVGMSGSLGERVGEFWIGLLLGTAMDKSIGQFFVM